MKIIKVKPIWSCKIGTLKDIKLPRGSDFPMRCAVAAMYKKLTGIEYEFLFSGWSAELTIGEIAIVKNRSISEIVNELD